MKNTIEHMEAIEALENGDRYFWSLGEGSGAEVWRIHDIYVLFEIPQYGGPPIFSQPFKRREIEDLVLAVLSWT